MADFSVDEIFRRVEELAPQYGIDPAAAKSIIVAENTSDGRIKRSSFSGSATNQNNTMGVGQVIPTTARGLQQAGLLPADWKFDPDNLDSQLAASLATMKDMKSRLRNPDDPLELGAYYNGGTEAWKAYQAGRPLNPETTQYLQKQRTYMADNQMTPQQIERAAAGQPAQVASPAMRRGASTSTRTTRNVFDEGALDNFNSASGLLNATINDAYNALGERNTGVAAAGQDAMSSIVAAGEAAGASAAATAALRAAGEERRAALLTRANLNPEQTNNRMDQALNALDVTSAMLEQKRPEIDARMSVGFFDNPLEYIVNAVRLPGMISEYNGLVGQQNDALQKYASAKAITSSAIDMSQAIDADKTLEAGAALANAEVKKAQASASTVNLQLQQKSASDALQAVQLAGQAASNSLQQLMLTKQLEAVRQGETEMQAKITGEQAALSEFNTLVKAAGGQGLPYDRFKQLPAKTRDEILSANSSGKFGGNFVQALNFVEKYGNLDTMAANGQLAVRTWINSTGNQVSADLEKMKGLAAAKGDKTFNPTKVAEQLLEAKAAQYSTAANSNMRGEPESNPYKINYKTIIQNPAFAGNSYVEMMRKYGPDGTEKQMVNYDEQDFLKRAVTFARLSGDPSFATKKLAADIATFYKTASREQQMTTKPQMFGLATPSKTYPVALPAYGTGALPKVLDLGDPTQVENLLTRQVAKEIAEQNPYSIAGARASTGTFGLVR